MQVLDDLDTYLVVNFVIEFTVVSGFMLFLFTFVSVSGQLPPRQIAPSQGQGLCQGQFYGRGNCPRTFFCTRQFFGVFFEIFCSSFFLSLRIYFIPLVVFLIAYILYTVCRFFHCIYTLYRLSFFKDCFVCLFFLALHCIFIYRPPFLSSLLFLLFVAAGEKLTQRSKR